MNRSCLQILQVVPLLACRVDECAQCRAAQMRAMVYVRAAELMFGVKAELHRHPFRLRGCRSGTANRCPTQCQSAARRSQRRRPGFVLLTEFVVLSEGACEYERRSRSRSRTARLLVLLLALDLYARRSENHEPGPTHRPPANPGLNCYVPSVRF